MMKTAYKVLFLAYLFSIISINAQIVSIKNNQKVLIDNYVNSCIDKIKKNSDIDYSDLERREGVSVFFDNELSQFKIVLKIHFRLESFVGDDAELIPKVEKKMNSTLKLSEEFYRLYGFQIEIIATYDLTQDYRPQPIPKGAALVYLRPFRGGTMNILRWGLNPKWSIEKRAKIYTHELAHFFGLPDEYEKAHGQNVVVSSDDDSFMKKWDHPEVKMYLRHAEAILKNICKE